MNKQTIRKAMQIITEGKISQISENVWMVNEHTILRQPLPGRTRLSCDCELSSRFCNTNGIICCHQVAIIISEYLKCLSEITHGN
jgi:hypothetical protein